MTDFSKNFSRLKFLENLPSRRWVLCRQTNRRTYWHDETNSHFLQLCKWTYKNYYLFVAVWRHSTFSSKY